MVIIVGTSHTIQTTDIELRAFLELLCREYNVRGVAEEMSTQALTEKGCSVSIPMDVSRTLGVPHRFCDPDREKRAKLGIRQENDIRLDGFLSNSSLSEAEVAACLAESNARRERYWLDQLRQFNVWPVLFVCGANHVTSFTRLLKQEGVVVHIAAEDRS